MLTCWMRGLLMAVSSEQRTENKEPSTHKGEPVCALQSRAPHPPKDTPPGVPASRALPRDNTWPLTRRIHPSAAHAAAPHTGTLKRRLLRRAHCFLAGESPRAPRGEWPPSGTGGCKENAGGSRPSVLGSSSLLYSWCFVPSPTPVRGTRGYAHGPRPCAARRSHRRDAQHSGGMPPRPWQPSRAVGCRSRRCR